MTEAHLGEEVEAVLVERDETGAVPVELLPPAPPPPAASMASKSATS